MRISRKLLLAMLVVSIVPLLLAGAIAERAVRAYAEGYSASRIHADSAFVADDIDHFLTETERNFQTMGIAISSREGKTADWSQVLTKLRGIYPDFRNLRLVDAAGTVIASDEPSRIGESVANVPEQLKALFRGALEAADGEVRFTDLGEAYDITRSMVSAGLVPAERTSEIMDLGVLMPIDDADDNRVGVLVGTVDTQPIMDTLAPYTLNGYDALGLEAFVIDADDRVLFNHHPTLNRPGEPMGQEYRSLIDTIADLQDANLAPMKTLRGEDVYLSVKPLTERSGDGIGRWTFVSVLPNELVVAGINEGFLKASLVLLMIVAAALIAALWLARSISRPIQALTESAEAMAAGDYSTRAQASPSMEVNQLALAFNRMGDAVEAERQALEAEIAERRLAQARADELQRRQELILDNAGDGLLGVDVKGRITFVNPAAAKLLGTEGVDLTGRNACEFWCEIRKDDPCTVCPLDPERLMANAGRPLQHVLNRRDGNRLAVEYVVSPLEGGAGLQGAVVAFRDVRHRKAYEDQLESGRREAETANRAKSEFLANMSHEIRTPMNGVLGFTNLLLETPLSEEQREHVDTIRGSAESLLHIINDILDFSKVEAGKLTVERLPFDLATAVGEVAGLFAPQAEEQGLELGVRMAPDVPSNMEADPGRVRQVLINLIGNAVKFTRQGHVLIEVESIAAAAGREVRCSVTDTGIGVPQDKQAALFEPFSQADTSTTREFGGTGLGLIISKRLVELMGGRIGFSSQPDRGSRFWFTLPEPARPVIEKVIPDGLAPADVRVLVVDDHAINRRLLSEQLKGWGMTHECVDSAARALERLHAARVSGAPFDIAVLDYLMPVMDGLELGRLIKADRSLADTRLIMLTSGSQRSASAAFTGAGFSEFLIKPLVKPVELLNAISRCCGARSQTTLPAVAPHASTAGPGNGHDAVRERLRAARLRILVAEDNPVNQRLIRAVLDKLGCRVDIAASGRSVLTMVAEQDYQVVLMDCLMPEMDGYQATAELRRRGYQVPIVALTANAMSQHREQCLAVGMDDYLSKPVRLEEIAGVLANWGLPGGTPAAVSTG